MIRPELLNQLFGSNPVVEFHGDAGTVVSLDNGRRFLSRTFAYTFVKFLHEQGFCLTARRLMFEHSEFEDQLEVLAACEKECRRCRLYSWCEKLRILTEFIQNAEMSNSVCTSFNNFLFNFTEQMVTNLERIGLKEKWNEYLKTRCPKPEERNADCPLSVADITLLSSFVGDLDEDDDDDSIIVLAESDKQVFPSI